MDRGRVRKHVARGTNVMLPVVFYWREEELSTFSSLSPTTESVDSFGITNKYTFSSDTDKPMPSPVPADSLLYNDYVKQSRYSHISTSTQDGYAMIPFRHYKTREDESPHSSLCLYIQMEYCSDGSLRDLLNRQDTPLAVRLDYFTQVELVSALYA